MAFLTMNPGLIGLGAVAVVWLLYALAKGVYNVFFHPLSKVPGPRLYAASQFPFLYQLLRGKWPSVLKEYHDRYGPAVRFTPGDVSFITPEAWKKIYGHKTDSERNFQKDIRTFRQSPSGCSNILNADDDTHRRMRRLLAHAFSEKALRNQEDIMQRYTDRFIARLGEKAREGEVVDIVRWFNFTTFDLVGDLAFGEPFGCLESGGYHPWVAKIFGRVKSTSLKQLALREPVLKPLLPLLVPARAEQSSAEHYELTRATAMRRLAGSNTEREDFVSYILRHNDDKGMSVDEIIDNSSVLIIAGSETTATLLSGTTFHLLRNRDAYDKVVAEVRAAFQTEGDITLATVNSLEYMIAVLTEGSRMFPTGLGRYTPRGGEYIEGHWIPEKTIVSVSQWSAYQSARNFRDPEKFAPERWLGDERYAKDVRDVLQPFSTGPRNCIGKNLAYAEMRLMLARLLWNFDLEMMPDSRDWNDQRIYSFWEKGPLNVRLTPVVRGEKD